MRTLLVLMVLVGAAVQAVAGGVADAPGVAPAAEPDGQIPESKLDRLLHSPSRLPTVTAGRAKKAHAELQAARISAAAKRASSDDGRGFGGEAVTAGTADWQAEIYYQYPKDSEKVEDYFKAHPSVRRWQKEHWCGGALIREGWVLTAAHCVLEPDADTKWTTMLNDDKAGFYEDFQKRRAQVTVSRKNHVSVSDCVKSKIVDPQFRVRLGAIEIDKKEGLVYTVDCVVIPQNWDPNDITHDDIALVHYATEVDDDDPDPGEPSSPGEHAKRLVLPAQPIEPDFDSSLRPGDKVSVTGWGKAENVEGKDPHAVLLKVDLKVKKKQECVKNLPANPKDLQSEGVFCAGSKAEETCLGDSGGPVVYTDGTPSLVGLVSWSKGDCSAHAKPGVFTLVSTYEHWIKDVLEAPTGR